MQYPKTWGIVAIYAAAMAWVEAAVVFYLRTMINRIEPYQETPLPVAGGLGAAELIRELATMVMLLTVGFLAGRNWRSRIGYSAIAFGVWDILYYVFLKIMCGWPHSLLDWDVLFLIPLPGLTVNIRTELSGHFLLKRQSKSLAILLIVIGFSWSASELCYEIGDRGICLLAYLFRP